MQRTPLFDCHKTAGGKLVDFAGWEMPIQYSGVLDEYHAVRAEAGLFDVSHMGRIAVTGGGALRFLQRTTTNDVAKLPIMQAHYSMVCNHQGGIEDDVFVYRLKPDDYLLCVNASNQEKILAWLREEVRQVPGCTVVDQSATLAQVALQGPASRDLLNKMGVPGIASLKLRHCLETTLVGNTCLIARTGYTGELGYECYVPTGGAASLWRAFLDHGRPAGLKPAGLGARDLLRLEMAYLLYGNDIDEHTTPMEAGVEWAVSFQKGDFIGRDALLKQKGAGLTRRFMAFELLEKGVPRHGFKITKPGTTGEIVGEVTSGNLSPLLQKGIGLGYVPPSLANPGASIVIDIRGKSMQAVVVKPPFYKKPRANG